MDNINWMINILNTKVKFNWDQTEVVIRLTREEYRRLVDKALREVYELTKPE